MDIQELKAWLTEGLTPEQSAAVTAALDRENVKSRVSGLKQQNEYNEIQTRAQALEAEMAGTDKVPGTRAYKKWHDDNIAAIVQLQKDKEAYEAKFGKLDGAPETKTAGGETFTKAQVEAMINENFQTKFAPNIAEVLKTTSRLHQKHMFAGRKSVIDFDAIDKIMQDQKVGLEAAYDKWDAPEFEKVTKANQEAEIDRRVKEELQKRGASTQFPAGADFTPGSLAQKSKADLDKYDPVALDNDLAKTFMSGEYSPGKAN